MTERPAAMYQRDRPIDPFFEPDEQLYLRVQPDQIDKTVERALCTAFRFPVQSVNRGKYSDSPTWVLYPNFFDWGIAAFEVQQIPTPVVSEGGVAYDFLVEHDPLEDNYPHSEVRAYRGKKREFKPGLKLRSSAKQLFRMRLSEVARLITRPGNQLIE